MLPCLVVGMSFEMAVHVSISSSRIDRDFRPLCPLYFHDCFFGILPVISCVLAIRCWFRGSNPLSMIISQSFLRLVGYVLSSTTMFCETSEINATTASTDSSRASIASVARDLHTLMKKSPALSCAREEQRGRRRPASWFMRLSGRASGLHFASCGTTAVGNNSAPGITSVRALRRAGQRLAYGVCPRRSVSARSSLCGSHLPLGIGKDSSVVTRFSCRRFHVLSGILSASVSSSLSHLSGVLLCERCACSDSDAPSGREVVLVGKESGGGGGGGEDKG